MARRAAILILLALVASAGAHAGGPGDRKRAVDSKIAALRARIAASNAREGVLTTQISTVTARIRELQGQVDAASARLGRLEGELAVYERRLDRLTKLLQAETEHLDLLRKQERVAVRRLNRRIVALYQTDEPSALQAMLSAGSLNDLVDALDYVHQIGRQDESIRTQVETARKNVQAERERTKRTRAAVQQASEGIRARVAEQARQRASLAASQGSLVEARSVKREALSSVRESKSEYLHEVSGLEKVSAGLAAQIRAAQARASAPSSTGSSSSSPSSSGFVWPVSGPIVSPFGWRWGRMHEGIDIAAGTGTPIVASAGGSVIYAGWMSGYGNLVVIDHGRGLATAYAHQSSVATSVGASVGQGQVIGYVGCTGHCLGPHVHFEVRSNGSPVDPMGYL